MGKRLTMLLANLFLFIGVCLAQTQVRGTVTSSEDGEPIVGASVLIIGTKTGTVSDVDGNFTLTLPEGKTLLEVSYLGMTPKKVKASPNMKVVLDPDHRALDEVMVVAYGTQKRSTITGSAVEVKAEDISKHVASTATNALGGKVAGVQMVTSSGEPGSAPELRIRGIGSYAASSEPLYVVDGAPFDGDIASLNPSDIESMSVLKDAASAAIYGARGANGVVIITTKKSRGAHGAKITLDAKWGSNSREIPRYDLILDPATYYEAFYRAMYNSKLYHGASDADARAFADANLLGNKNGGLGYQVFTIPTGEKFIGDDFKLNPNAKLGYSDGKYTYMPDNYYDEIFHSSFRQEYNVNINGATDKLSYYSNLGFLGDGGTVNNSSFKRYTARTNVDYQAKDWLRFGVSLSYSHTDSSSPSFNADTYGSSGNLFYIANQLGPIYPLYVRDANGNIMKDNGRTVYDANQTGFKRPAVIGNAVRDNEYNRKSIATDQFQGNWVATVTPIEGLNLVANLSVWNRNRNYHYLDSRFGSASTTDGAVEVGNDRYFSTNQIYTANYDKTFGKHAINLLAGYEHYFLKVSDLSGYNDHLYDPTIAELNNALARANLKAGSSTNTLVRDGYFFRGDYNYADKYFAEASLRHDGSSIFAPGHRWGTFWSVSVGWAINKEKWFTADWVDLLKLKLSYGEQGNDGLLDRSGYRMYYPYTDTYKTSYNEATKEFTNQIAYKGNANLTWEKSGELNLGVDFSLFKHRLNGTLEVFNKKTTDLLFWKTLPLSSGISVTSYPANIGAMSNKGFELSLDGDVVRSKTLTWNVNLNMTYFKNKITELDPTIAKDGLKAGSSIIRIGGSRYEAYMYKYAGTDKSNGHATYYKDVIDANGNVTGQTTTTDLTQATRYDLGDINPKVYGGFGTTLNAYGFDFSMQFSYQLGGKVYDGQYQQYMHLGQSTGVALHKDALGAWSADNTSSNIPRLSTAKADDGFAVGSQSAVDYFLTSSDYLSLNNVTLGYSFPKRIINHLALNSLRVYVAGENLFVVTARKGLDPRTTLEVGGFTSGSALISGGGYAALRSITAGITLTF